MQIGETQITKQFIGPKDSISSLYGNGFDLCGARQYQVFGEDGLPYKGDAFALSVKAAVFANGADIISLNLKSFEGYGPILTDTISIKIYLSNYPDAQIIFKIGLEYRECSPSIFEGNIIERQRIITGSPAYSIPLIFK
jgi:hypothetical protein